MGQPVKVVVGVPSEGHAPVAAYDNRMLWAFHLGKFEEQSKGKFEFYWNTCGRMFVPMAREILAEAAVGLGADFIHFVDDDMIVPTDLFEKLYSHFSDPTVSIVGALAFTRNHPHYPVIYSCKEGWDSIAREEYFINEYVLNYPRNTLVECDAVGFGSVLIRTSVLAKMKKPWFMSSQGTGEDILFSYKCKREAKGRVFMDTSVKLGHIGDPRIITEETFDETHKDKKFQDIYGDYKGPGVVFNGK